MVSESGNQNLRYHQRVFEFLKQKPTFHENYQAAISAIELFVKGKLPHSVAEWFSLEGASSLIRLNNDHVLPVNSFYLSPNPLFGNHPGWATPELKSDDIIVGAVWNKPESRLIEDDLLKIIVENQGVCKWAVELDDSDEDPPVWMRLNEPNERWRPVADTFSDFVFARAWDTWIMHHTPYTLQSVGKLFRLSEIGFLDEKYGLIHHDCPHPAYHDCYRFGDGDKQIRVCQGNPRIIKDQADLLISASSLVAFEELVRAIWLLSDLSSSLYHYDPDSPESKLLRKLRAKQ